MQLTDNNQFIANVQLTPDEAYSQRVTDGTYASILSQINALGPATLGSADYGTHFMRSKSVEGSCYSYVDCSDGSTFSTILFGEICHSTEGTRLSAAGNHFAGPNNLPVKDNTNVKDVLVLRLPTFAPEDLKIHYHNQVATLGEVRVADEAEEDASGHKPAVVKECIKASPFNPDGPMDLIIVTLPRKYAVPPSNKDSVQPKAARITKKRLTSEIDVETTEGCSDSKNADPFMSNTDKCEPDFKVELGAFYPLYMLPDHRGSFFQQQKAKLVQHNIKDLENNLITPWDAYNKLRHGTVVLIQASLIIWVIKDGDASPEKKFYQLVADSVRVIAESPEAPEVRTMPVLRSKPSFTGTTSPTKLATQAFESFQSPSKKSRTN